MTKAEGRIWAIDSVAPECESDNFFSKIKLVWVKNRWNQVAKYKLAPWSRIRAKWVAAQPNAPSPGRNKLVQNPENKRKSYHSSSENILLDIQQFSGSQTNLEPPFVVLFSYRSALSTYIHNADPPRLLHPPPSVRQIFQKPRPVE